MNSWEWTTWLVINTNQALQLWSFSNAILDDHFALNKMPWSSLPVPYVRYFTGSLPKKTSQKKRLLPRCQGRCMESLEMFHELRILLVKSSTFRSLGPRRWGYETCNTKTCRPRLQGTLSCGLSRCSGIFITWFFKKLAPLKLHTRRILLETILIAKGGKATGSKGHSSIIRKAQLLLDETLPVLLILLELLTVSSWQNTSLCPFKNKELAAHKRACFAFANWKASKSAASWWNFMAVILSLSRIFEVPNIPRPILACQERQQREPKPIQTKPKPNWPTSKEESG